MTYGIFILFVNLIIQKAMRKSNFQSAASKGNHWGGLSSSAGASWKSVSSSLESNPSQHDPQSLSEVLTLYRDTIQKTDIICLITSPVRRTAKLTTLTS